MQMAELDRRESLGRRYIEIPVYLWMRKEVEDADIVTGKSIQCYLGFGLQSSQRGYLLGSDFHSLHGGGG